MQKLEKSHFTRDIGQISPKMKSREFSIFIIFPDAYTCTYVVQKVWADSDQNWIFFTNF